MTTEWPRPTFPNDFLTGRYYFPSRKQSPDFTADGGFDFATFELLEDISIVPGTLYEVVLGDYTVTELSGALAGSRTVKVRLEFVYTDSLENVNTRQFDQEVTFTAPGGESQSFDSMHFFVPIFNVDGPDGNGNYNSSFPFGVASATLQENGAATGDFLIEGTLFGVRAVGSITNNFQVLNGV